MVGICMNPIKLSAHTVFKNPKKSLHKTAQLDKQFEIFKVCKHRPFAIQLALLHRH